MLAILPLTTVAIIPLAANNAVNASTVNLYDSSGGVFEANWIEVASLQNAIDAHFTIQVSSLGSNVHDINGTTSSVVGISGSTDMRGAKSKIEFFAGDTGRFSQIQIHHTTGADHTFAINYGVKVPVNPLRFKDRPKGN